MAKALQRVAASTPMFVTISLSRQRNQNGNKLLKHGRKLVPSKEISLEMGSQMGHLGVLCLPTAPGLSTMSIHADFGLSTVAFEGVVNHVKSLVVVMFVLRNCLMRRLLLRFADTCCAFRWLSFSTIPNHMRLVRGLSRKTAT